MADEKETPVEQVAPVNNEAQPEQVATTEEVATPPEAVSDKGEEKLYAGKFKSVEDLEKSYGELQSSFTKERQAMAQPREQVPEQATAPYDNAPQLDPESAQAVDRIVDDRIERKKATDFAHKHKDELKDPILAGTVQRLLVNANQKGEYIDQEEAFTQAKKMLDERVKPQMKEAQSKGVEQGEDIAKKKGQLGAVGETGARPEVNPDDLDANEFAKHHGLKYID